MKIFLVLVILLLCIYCEKESSSCFYSIKEYLKYSDKYEGYELICPYGMVKEITYNNFKIWKERENVSIWVKATHPLNLKRGDIISVRGIFHKERYLELKKFHLHKMRNLKEIISIVPTVFILFLFFFNYKFDFKTFTFKKKIKCQIL